MADGKIQNFLRERAQALRPIPSRREHHLRHTVTLA